MDKNYTLYQNTDGPDIGVVSKGIIKEDGKIFRDLTGDGKLYPFEDWRLDPKERAKDLAERLSTEEIAGLMLYSPHQMVPSLPDEPFAGTYENKPFKESGADAGDLTDQQKALLEKGHIRHLLAMKLQDAKTAAKWSNNLQAYAEALPFGIPVNISSDPRHGAGSAAGQEFKSGGGGTSKWPEGLGMAATFSPEAIRQFGEAVADEYRALGILTSLSPQVDLGTEPRWMRLEDTFGTNPEQVTEYGKIFTDALQTTEGSPDGWGKKSVVAMAKHWPGGATGEGGRDAHYAFGKYNVYPGDEFETHLKPFTEGVFDLDGPTGKAGAVMPYYSVSWEKDEKNGKNVGNSYSEYLIKDLLRNRYGYDGIVCTDWGITQDPASVIDAFGSRPYGVENLGEAERHLLAIDNGVDQFGGNSDIKPLLEAYRMGEEKYGKEVMRKRFEDSAKRLLVNLFRTGLFDNPYLDPEESEKIVGNETYVRNGYEAQKKSLVLLKNKGVLPIRERMKVYIPERTIKPRKNFFRGIDDERKIVPFDRDLIEEYFDLADTLEEADFALVAVESPLSDGYSEEDLKLGGNGYLPISLQYRPYRADEAREKSLAGGDFREETDNRSYKEKTGTAANEADLDLVIGTKEKMGDKPVIVSIRMHNPAVLSELEPYADAIITDFGVEDRAILDLIRGDFHPSGKLPVVLPKNMQTVEAHQEDTPFDYEAYTDTEGNRYDYGFGLTF